MGQAVAVRFSAALVAIGAAISVSSCTNNGELGKAPPRSDSPVVYEPQTSSFTVPLTLDASFLRTELEKAIPKKLYTLRQHVSECIPSQKVKVFGAKIPVSPKFACDVAIDVSRGPLTLSGGGENIRVTVPIYAHAKASKIAGVIYETANGSANAHVTAKLDITPDWQLTGKLGLGYDWTSPPTVRFLGHNFTFADQVDQQLRPIIAKVQQQIPGELAKLNLRSKVDSVWREGFAVMSLNGENPPVWMRITPSKLMFGGYSISGPIVKLSLGIKGTTETFLGGQPKPKPPIALPRGEPLEVSAGKTNLFVPVVSPYNQIEPVILDALVKRAQRPFEVSDVGAITARFDKVEAYGTTNDQIAVGLTLSVWPQNSPKLATTGTVWLVGTVINPENTRKLMFKDLHVNGATDKSLGNILIRVCNLPSVSDEIAGALSQDFENDYQDLRKIIDEAIASNRVGDLVLTAKIDTMRSGSLKVAGQGLYLPVWAEGQTTMAYRPN